MNWIIGYFVIGAVWAVFAGRMQFKSGLSTRMDLQFWLCLALNLVLWPLAVCMYRQRNKKGRYR